MELYKFMFFVEFAVIIISCILLYSSSVMKNNYLYKEFDCIKSRNKFKKFFILSFINIINIIFVYVIPYIAYGKNNDELSIMFLNIMEHCSRILNIIIINILESDIPNDIEIQDKKTKTNSFIFVCIASLFFLLWNVVLLFYYEAIVKIEYIVIEILLGMLFWYLPFIKIYAFYKEKRYESIEKTIDIDKNNID